MTPVELSAALSASVPFVRFVGYEVVDIDGTSVTVTLPDHPGVKNHIGTAHAAAAYGAGETASGGVVLLALGSALGEVTPVLKEATVNYTAAATGVVSATATPASDPAAAVEACLLEGRALLEVDCTLRSGDGSENATAAFVWYLKRN